MSFPVSQPPHVHLPRLLQNKIINRNISQLTILISSNIPILRICQPIGLWEGFIFKHPFNNVFAIQKIEKSDEKIAIWRHFKRNNENILEFSMDSIYKTEIGNLRVRLIDIEIYKFKQHYTI